MLLSQNHCNLSGPICKEYYQTAKSIKKRFWPSVFGGPIAESEQQLFSLPAHLGGMGIFDPVEVAKIAYTTSRACTNMVVTAIKNNVDFVMSSYIAQVNMVKTERHKEHAIARKLELDSVLISLGDDIRRAIQRAIDGKTYCYANCMPPLLLCQLHATSPVMPIACHLSCYANCMPPLLLCQLHATSPVEFRDALSLRYHRPLLKTPMHCDGCGNEFSFQHALDCKKGGLVTQHHNEVRDALGDLAAIMYKDLVRESIVQEADDANGRPA